MHRGLCPLLLKIVVCFILGIAPVLLAPQAVASSSALIASAQGPFVDIKTDKRNCWQRCRHLCSGRPRSACSLCIRQCRAQTASTLAE